jgi:hypothetical protein
MTLGERGAPAASQCSQAACRASPAPRDGLPPGVVFRDVMPAHARDGGALRRTLENPATGLALWSD